MPDLYNDSSNKNNRRSLRSNMPQPEILLWSRLKSRQIMGCKFRRQYGIGRYIIDFYCPEARLAIEIDGESHYLEGAQQRDKERQAFIESQDIQVLRFTNTDVMKNLDGVAEVVLKAVKERIK